jgi:V/A-type H+-transporting ATPase subunit F
MDYFFLGDPELVTAFRLLGINGVPVRGADDASSAFRKITESYDEIADTIMPGMDTYRILIVTEEVADWLGDSLVNWQLKGRYPLIVEVPGLMGRLPGRKTLMDSIREAIGVHV